MIRWKPHYFLDCFSTLKLLRPTRIRYISQSISYELDNYLTNVKYWIRVPLSSSNSVRAVVEQETLSIFLRGELKEEDSSSTVEKDPESFGYLTEL